MVHLTVDQLFAYLKANTGFFSVEFQRRTRRPGGPPGSKRKMLCRTGVKQYQQGMQTQQQRDARDFQHCILTVWDVGVYQNHIRSGLDQNYAAWNSWRTIDLTTVNYVSIDWIADNELPPDIIANLHNITNAYRLANLPRGTI